MWACSSPLSAGTMRIIASTLSTTYTSTGNSDPFTLMIMQTLLHSSWSLDPSSFCSQVMAGTWYLIFLVTHHHVPGGVLYTGWCNTSYCWHRSKPSEKKKNPQVCWKVNAWDLLRKKGTCQDAVLAWIVEPCIALFKLFLSKGLWLSYHRLMRFCCVPDVWVQWSTKDLVQCSWQCGQWFWESKHPMVFLKGELF